MRGTMKRSLSPAVVVARLVLAAGLNGGAALAAAASLQVSVIGADGRPAADTVVMVQIGGAAPAPAARAVVTVEQKDSRFLPYVAVVNVGSSVRFVNRDGYDHHIRSLPGGPGGNVAPAKMIELRLGPARRGNDTSEEIRLELPGTVLLGCHLHGSMRGHLFVTAAPYVAVTDDKGQARLDGLPDSNSAQVRLWHPDQLVEQAAQTVPISGSASVQAQLNITPRRRAPPRRADQEYGPPGANN
jgi:plastocyanin